METYHKSVCAHIPRLFGFLTKEEAKEDIEFRNKIADELLEGIEEKDKCDFKIDWENSSDVFKKMRRR